MRFLLRGRAAWLTVWAACASLPAFAQEAAPPDVYARVMLLRGHVEQIRVEMGKPAVAESPIEISGAAPREVYFQAQTLFEKANRLSFEHTRQIGDPLPHPGLSIRPEHVLAVVNSALARIRLAKQELGIPEPVGAPAVDESKTPTDVIVVTVHASRELNQLLEEPFTPSEVYRQVTVAMGYAARLRAYFPGDRIPEVPEFVRGKEPRDVRAKLFDCLSIVHEIANLAGVEMLRVEPAANRAHVTPSDVYDLATLVVSELAFLWSRLEDAPPPRPAYDPGRKFPSHVFQRAGHLERQLSELLALAEVEPDWLK